MQVQANPANKNPPLQPVWQGLAWAASPATAEVCAATLDVAQYTDSRPLSFTHYSRAPYLLTMYSSSYSVHYELYKKKAILIQLDGASHPSRHLAIDILLSTMIPFTCRT